MARADGRHWFSRPRAAEPRATGRWWVEQGGRWVLRPGTPDEARPAVAECDAADTLTVRTPDGRLLARVVGDPVRPVGDTERRWRDALGARVDDSLRVVDPRGSVLAAVRPLPEGGTDLAVVDPFPRSAQGRRASAEVDGREMAQMRASGPWILRNGPDANCALRELVDHTDRTLITDSFPRSDEGAPGNRESAPWDIRLDCAPLPVSWAFAVLVACEILRTRAITDRLPGM